MILFDLGLFVFLLIDFELMCVCFNVMNFALGCLDQIPGKDHCAI